MAGNDFFLIICFEASLCFDVNYTHVCIGQTRFPNNEMLKWFCSFQWIDDLTVRYHHMHICSFSFLLSFLINHLLRWWQSAYKLLHMNLFSEMKRCKYTQMFKQFKMCFFNFVSHKLNCSSRKSSTPNSIYFEWQVAYRIQQNMHC